MPLRMSIAAVISVGLAVGAQFVTGQAAQRPPRVAEPSASQVGAPRPDGIAPPRVASPEAMAIPGPRGDGGSPPRVAEPGAMATGGALPKLPGGDGDGPPAVGAPATAVDPPIAPAVASPPPVARAPEVDLPPASPAGAPPDVPDAMTFGLGGITQSAPPAEASAGDDSPPVVPATAHFEDLPDLGSPEDGRAAPPGAVPDPFAGGMPVEGPSMAVGAPFDDGADVEDGLPALDAASQDPAPFEVGGLGDDPIFGLPGTPPDDPGPPDDDPIFGGAAPVAPEPPQRAEDEPGIGGGQVVEGPARVGDPIFGGSTPTPAAPPGGGRPGAPAPDFSSTEPPADLSLRTSAVPRDGIGAMAESLADRLSEGPREIALNLDVAQPQTSNINLPMKAVITLRNDGRDDAFDVAVRLPLPDGLLFLESSPQPDEQLDEGRSLVWRWSSLAPGDIRTIELTVKPEKAVPMDLVPRVSSVMAAKARTTVQKPELKIDLVGPNGDVLKGSEFDFKITVRNVGNGPARRVNLMATLTGGLKGRDHNGELSDAPRFEQMIGDLQPGEVFGPVALSVMADSKGAQTCTIEALSPDVVPATPVSAKPVNIVMPELVLEVIGPESRPVGSMAEYVVTITNRGTAEATDVAVALFAPESGNPEVPKDAKYRQDPDKRLHSIYWRIPRLDKGESRQYRVPIRLDRIALYTVEAAAHSEGFREPRDTRRAQKTTDVMGIPDVKIVDVARKDPVIDAGDTTEFEIRIKNIGSKEATNVFVDFFTNEWLAVAAADPPNAKTSDQNPYHHGFDPIDRLAPGADRTFVVTVKALKAGPAVANFDVKVYWDGLQEGEAVRYNNYVRIAEGQVARSGANAPR